MGIELAGQKWGALAVVLAGTMLAAASDAGADEATAPAEDKHTAINFGAGITLGAGYLDKAIDGAPFTASVGFFKRDGKRLWQFLGTAYIPIDGFGSTAFSGIATYARSARRAGKLHIINKSRDGGTIHANRKWGHLSYGFGAKAMVFTGAREGEETPDPVAAPVAGVSYENLSDVGHVYLDLYGAFDVVSQTPGLYGYLSAATFFKLQTGILIGGIFGEVFELTVTIGLEF